MTIAEKVLARTAGEAEVAGGQIVEAEPDLYMSHTASWRCIDTLERLGTDELYAPDRIAMVMDHISPARDAKTADDHRRCRRFAEAHDIEQFFDVNAGISHIVLMEEGLVEPGMLVIGTDSHSTIYGALGACGTGVGYSDVTATWVTGKLWLKVPESIHVVVDGSLQPGVSAKDLMLRIIGDLSSAGASYRSVEFSGSYVERTTIAERKTMCNLAKELGAMFAVVSPDDTTRSYLRDHGADPDAATAVRADADATYEEVVTIDANSFEPQIACPHTVDNVKAIGEVVGTHLDQVFIGSCANANYEDLAKAAAILEGHSVAPGVRLVVTPASKAVMQEAADSGVLSTFIDAGALITNPGCGACAGDGGVMADGEVTLSTANRNYQGRMGSYDAEIYLSSPETAAASAIRGVISDPRETGAP